MRRLYGPCVLLLAFAPVLLAAPPEAPAKLTGRAGKPVLFDVKVEAGKKLGWAPGFDRAACPVLRLYSDDPAVMSFLALPDASGVYVLTWWTGGETAYSQTTITVGGPPAPAPAPPPVPGPVPPTPRVYYFLIVRPDGPAAPAFTEAMGRPAWKLLTVQGHQYKDKTVSGAARDVGFAVPAGTPLPCVVTLSTEGGVSRVVRPAVPLPTTDAAILDLPKSVPTADCEGVK